MNAYTQQGQIKRLGKGRCDNENKNKTKTKKRGGRTIYVTNGSPNFLLLSSKVPNSMHLRIVSYTIPSKALDVKKRDRHITFLPFETTLSGQINLNIGPKVVRLWHSFLYFKLNIDYGSVRFFVF